MNNNYSGRYNLYQKGKTMEEFFSLQGRLNRGAFFLLVMGVGVISRGIFNLPSSLQIIAFILLIWILSMLYIKRLHDIGMSGWTLLAGYIVFMVIMEIDDYLGAGCGIIFNLYLFLKKGDEGENEYGEDPLEEISSESNYKKKQAIEIIDNYDLYKDKNGQIEVVLHYLDEEENNPYLYISDKQAILYYSKNKTIVLDKFPQKYLKEIQKSPIILFYEVEGDDIIKKYAVKVNPE